MYEMNYDVWVDAGVANRLPEEQHYWVDKNGERVASEAESAGCKVTIEITHPEWILFGDEVGSDVCQDDDGQIGGQTYVVARGSRAGIKSSTKTSRWTTIGLTAASGDPVMCIIIMSGKEMNFMQRMGYDHFVSDENKLDPNIPLNEVNTNNYTGPGRLFPGGPTCTFRGKQVLALVTMSSTGSITSEILRAAFERLDEIGVYPRSNPLRTI